MTATPEAKMWRALRKRLDAYPNPPIWRYPGDLRATPEELHALVTVIGVPPIRTAVADGQPHEHRGTLQLVLRHPLANLNYTKTREDAGKLASYFKDGTCMQDQGLKMRVYEYPEVGDGFNADGWWNTPIRIRWETAA